MIISLISRKNTMTLTDTVSSNNLDPSLLGLLHSTKETNEFLTGLVISCLISVILNSLKPIVSSAP
jgi:hypothetical protein